MSDEGDGNVRRVDPVCDALCCLPAGVTDFDADSGCFLLLAVHLPVPFSQCVEKLKEIRAMPGAPIQTPLGEGKIIDGSLCQDVPALWHAAVAAPVQRLLYQLSKSLAKSTPQASVD